MLEYSHLEYVITPPTSLQSHSPYSNRYAYVYKQYKHCLYPHADTYIQPIIYMAPNSTNTHCECTSVAIEVKRYGGDIFYYEIGVGFHPGCKECSRCKCTSITMAELEEARWEVYVCVNKNCKFCSKNARVCTVFVQMVDYGDKVVVVGDAIVEDTFGETVESTETRSDDEKFVSLETASTVEKAI
jgi:hypothetical protein